MDYRLLLFTFYKQEKEKKLRRHEPREQKGGGGMKFLADTDKSYHQPGGTSLPSAAPSLVTPKTYLPLLLSFLPRSPINTLQD